MSPHLCAASSVLFGQGTESDKEVAPKEGKEMK
jgi:hypothetical protein